MEHATERLVGVERLGVPAAAVQGEHQLPAQSLPKRVAAYEPVELGDELRVASECQLGLDALLEAREALLLQP